MCIYSYQIRSSLSFVVWSYDLFCGSFYILWTCLSLNLVPHVERMRGEIGDRGENGLMWLMLLYSASISTNSFGYEWRQKDDLPHRLCPWALWRTSSHSPQPWEYPLYRVLNTSDGFWLISLLLLFSFFL